MGTFGLLGQYPIVGWSIFVAGLVLLFFWGVRSYIWTLFVLVGLWLLQPSPTLWGVVFIALMLVNIPALRRQWFSGPLMGLVRKWGLMPSISATEREALDAGTLWIETELFGGKPDFRKIRQAPYPDLQTAETAFMEKQVRTLCALVSDWEIFAHGDLPGVVWDYLKRERFFGLVIPRMYDGLGFSARGHGEIVAALATHSLPLAMTVAVPNSLGPGELLMNYGTQRQKEYYLPRLARGEEIPCFALTEPHAGSDAGSITSSAEVFRGENGQLYLRLNWEKRYITLASVATLIGLAVRLKDPANLLGMPGGPDHGITCILVPANAKGIKLDQRHNPMGLPLHNCPIKGVDVIVPLDQVIGGMGGIGKGWMMLMESLATGRALSLPAQCAGSAKALVWLTGSYAAVRTQFGHPIGRFEGVEEPLTRIAALSYLMDATRIFTTGAIDSGKKPAVVSAICKYYLTELSRQLVNDGMDVMAGAGICRGERNRIANAYIGTPVAITVEGANILTRSMIIFGQGALRCHPYAYREWNAVIADNPVEFDRALSGHLGHLWRNLVRSLLLSLTRGHLAASQGGPTSRYYQKLAWSSASFALLSDIAMIFLGGRLKLKEKLTGRFADVLAWMYLASATLRRFEAEHFPPDRFELVEWSLQYAMTRIQAGFDGILANMEIPLIGWLWRGPIGLWSRLNPLAIAPSDALGHHIAQSLLQPGQMRDALIKGVIISARAGDAGERLEEAFNLCHESRALRMRVKNAAEAGVVLAADGEQRLLDAVAAGLITPSEKDLIVRAEFLQNDVIQVDAFARESFRNALLESSRDEDDRQAKLPITA